MVFSICTSLFVCGCAPHTQSHTQTHTLCMAFPLITFAISCSLVDLPTFSTCLSLPAGFSLAMKPVPTLHRQAESARELTSPLSRATSTYGCQEWCTKPQLPHPLERINLRCLFNTASQGFPLGCRLPTVPTVLLSTLCWLPSLPASLLYLSTGLLHLPNKLLALDSYISGPNMGEPQTNTHMQSNYSLCKETSSDGSGRKKLFSQY